MVSALFGVGAAVCWAAATLWLAYGARSLPLASFGVWYLGYQTLLIAPVALASLLSSPSVQLPELWPAIAAGVAEGVGILAYGQALRSGEVGVAAALVSLEGAFAAMIAIIAGEVLTLLTAVGLAAACCGGVAVGTRRIRFEHSPGAGYALLTAAVFGVALWLINRSDLPIAVTLFVFSFVGAATVLAAVAVRRGQDLSHPTSTRSVFALGAAALGSLGGFALFDLGADAESLAITAVIGAQFALLATLGGRLLWNERLTAFQLAGVAIVALGVSLVSLGAS